MKLPRPLLFILIVASCRQPDNTQLFTLVKDSGIRFTNTVTDLPDDNNFYYRNYYNGGGVAIGDINNDGLSDVVLTSNMGDNKLFLNKGGVQFTDITTAAGFRQDSMWSTGVLMADINNDGWLDIYICNAGHLRNGNRRNKLYINQQDNTFIESAAAYGLDIKAFTTQTSFFDYDLDGDLDCFMINNSPIPVNTLGYSNKRDVPDSLWAISPSFRGGGDHLYRNDNGHFTEVTGQAGIHGSLISFGLGVSVGDLNNDGYPDVYVSNDFYERDYLYINQGNGTFRDEMEERIEQNSFASMGADLADVNNDGYLDAFTTDMLPDDDFRLKTLGAFDNIDLYNQRVKTGFYHQFTKNCLYINNREGRFVESAYYSGVSASDWSWGALFFDADNDGLNDIYVCNGVNRDVTNLDFMDYFANDVAGRMSVAGATIDVDSILNRIPSHPVPNKLFKNLGGLRFSDAGSESGISQLSFSNGAAYGDLDNDGDLDLVVNNVNMESFVYRNNSIAVGGNNYIGFMLKGHGLNQFAVGAKIKLFQGGQVFYREVMPGRGFQSSSDYKQIIGIGQLTKVDSVQVIWPGNDFITMVNPAINTLHKISQASTPGKPYLYPPAINNQDALLTAVPVVMDRHQEDGQVDFYYERNVPEMLSREGPALASADLNGDGLDDVYIGGGKGQDGMIYMQEPSGAFKRVKQSLRTAASADDVAALFFDADNDGDADLLVGSGGNIVMAAAQNQDHRLYFNDGKGNFRLGQSCIPPNVMNVSVCVNADYDGDGDQDLFVGARSYPQDYGRMPRSYIYNNDGKGIFTDVTDRVQPLIRNAGMVTGAAWCDLDKNGQPELVITGQWMATQVFSFDKASGVMKEWKGTGLEKLYGWWHCVKAADLNGDGFPDLVIGNIGQNFYLRPSPERPVKMWVSDFDNNGASEPFITRTVEDGKETPVFLKREITDQFPALKKQNLRHSEYARKTIQQLFPAELLRASSVRLFNYASSIIALNDGKGHFTVSELPAEVQLSSVNCAAVSDLNGDGAPDLLLAGNMFTFQPQFGRLDGSYGHVLINNGKGAFHTIPASQSGVSARGQSKGIVLIRGRNTNQVLIARNNDIPLLYKMRLPAQLSGK